MICKTKFEIIYNSFVFVFFTSIPAWRALFEFRTGTLIFLVSSMENMSLTNLGLPVKYEKLLRKIGTDNPWSLGASGELEVHFNKTHTISPWDKFHVLSSFIKISFSIPGKYSHCPSDIKSVFVNLSFYLKKYQTKYCHSHVQQIFSS